MGIPSVSGPDPDSEALARSAQAVADELDAARLDWVRIVDVTCSADSSTNTTDNLRERICAPYALMADIELARNAGFNGARLHEKVFEERYLYHAEREGCVKAFMQLVGIHAGDRRAGRVVAQRLGSPRQAWCAARADLAVAGPAPDGDDARCRAGRGPEGPAQGE